MILGIGLDIVDLDRIEEVLKKWGDKFIDKILTPNEKRSIPKNRVQYVGSRFAAKEAMVKALGTGFSYGISFKDIEVISQANSSPEIVLNGNAKIVADKKKIKRIFLSISHEKNIATAAVVLEG